MLNEAELLLVKEWQNARQLEKTLETVRKKYAALQDDVAAAVTKEFPELTVSKVRDDPPGLWMDQLRIERLTDPMRPGPSASVWLPKRVVRGLGKSTADLRHTLQQATETAYPADERSELLIPDNGGEAAVYFRAPNKSELVDLLTAGDFAPFVQRVSGVFRHMTRMIPALDSMLL